jgi:uncharacterized phiE125 gp8 family phage protein
MFGYGFEPEYAINSARSWTYYDITAPSVLPLTVSEVAIHLKINWTPDSDLTAYLTNLIISVVTIAEKYTNRNLLTRSVRTYRDYFEPFIELRRYPITSISKFNYTNVNGTIINLPITFPNNTYYLTNEIYPKIKPYPTDFPQDAIDQDQCIIIEFNAGYLTSAALLIAMPDIKIALLSHIAFMYANRGDSDNASIIESGAGGSISSTLAIPTIARQIYNRYRIKTLTTQGYSRQTINRFL